MDPTYLFIYLLIYLFIFFLSFFFRVEKQSPWNLSFVYTSYVSAPVRTALKIRKGDRVFSIL